MASTTGTAATITRPKRFIRTSVERRLPPAVLRHSAGRAMPDCRLRCFLGVILPRAGEPGQSTGDLSIKGRPQRRDRRRRLDDWLQATCVQKDQIGWGARGDGIVSRLQPTAARAVVEARHSVQELLFHHLEQVRSRLKVNDDSEASSI